MDDLLAYGPGAARSGWPRRSQADRGLAVAHVGLALLALVQGDAATARDAMARARETVDGATRRERQHVEAVSAFIGGESARGFALADEHVEEFPRDAVLVNQVSSAIALAGAERSRGAPRGLHGAARARLRRRLVVPVRARLHLSRGGPLRGVAAALGGLARPVSRATRSAAHNLAHIAFETLDIEAGAAFLDEWMAGYDRRASFHCHLAWHQAMFALHEGRYAQALDIFERDILRSGNPRSAMTDGTALLWRVRLDAASARPLPWRTLADMARGASRAPASSSARCTPPGLRGLRRRGGAGEDDGRPAGAGREGQSDRGPASCCRWCRGRPRSRRATTRAALAHFEPVEAEMHRIGGSHAQWEIFEETMVACYLELARYDDALRLVRRRLARRASPRDQQWLARASAAAGER